VIFVIACVVAGVAIGVLSGLLGIGGGTLTVPFLVLVGGFAQQQAQATSLAAMFPAAIMGVITLKQRGVGDPRTALTLGCVGAAGSLGGSLAALALPGAVLRIVFAVFMAGVGLRLTREGLRMRAREHS
jgi:uncharacterized protein